jgi:transcriptional regulator NrdR family protein
MKCPLCEKRLYCTDTREAQHERAMKRRYSCTCGARLITKECIVSVKKQEAQNPDQEPERAT